MSNAPQTITMVMPITIRPSVDAPSRMAVAGSMPMNRRFSRPKTPMAMKTDSRIVISRIRNRRVGVAALI